MKQNNMFIQVGRHVDLEETNPLRQHTMKVVGTYLLILPNQFQDHDLYAFSLAPLNTGEESLRSAKIICKWSFCQRKMGERDHTRFVEFGMIIECHYFLEFGVRCFNSIYKNCNDCRWVMVGTAMSASRQIFRWSQNLLRKNRFKANKIQK